MNKEFVQRFLIENGKYFPAKKLDLIGNILEQSTKSEYAINRKYLNPVPTMIIMFFLFGLGLMIIFDRLVLKDWFWGSIKVILPIILGTTLYLYGASIYIDKSPAYFVIMGLSITFVIWSVIDIFTLYRRIKIANYRKLLKSLNISSDAIITKNIETVDDINREANANGKNSGMTLNEIYRRNGSK